MTDAVRRAREVLDSSYRELRGSEEEAAAVGLPLQTLRKSFRRELGEWPREYLERRQVK